MPTAGSQWSDKIRILTVVAFLCKGWKRNDRFWHGPTNPCNQVVFLPVLVNNASHWRDQNVTWGDCSGIEWLLTREMILTDFFFISFVPLLDDQLNPETCGLFFLPRLADRMREDYFFPSSGSASKQPAGKRGAHRWNASDRFKANDHRRKHKFTRQGSQLLSVMPRIHSNLIGCPVVSIQWESPREFSLVRILITQDNNISKNNNKSC